MPCEHNKDALIEAAASGAALQDDLRVHLDTCLDCRAVFEQEQVLFASIDADLRVTADAEIPASLLPRVRARLDDESAPRRVWGTSWLALASAAVMVVAFLAARVVWRANVVQRRVETTAIASAPQVTPSPRNQAPVDAPPMVKKPSPQRLLAIAKTAPVHQTPVSGKANPEVLVPRDQEILLAEYAEQWRLYKRAPLVAQSFDATVLAPLQVAQIQIDELDVKLLADDKSQ